MRSPLHFPFQGASSSRRQLSSSYEIGHPVRCHSYAPLSFVSCALVLALVLILAPAPRGEAATALEGFAAGHLIGDDLVYGPAAGASLTDAQIQAFLDQSGSTCSRGADGSACLKSYSTSLSATAATRYCSGAVGARSGATAAQVVGAVARACGISPKVLLVKLQKEQGLVTTTNPTAAAYEKAMGFRCPDGQPCETKYAGFANQVYNAASRFQEYRMDPGRWTYRAGMSVDVPYSPDASCGSARVTLVNAATAALYNYTPYQPNAASLAAVAGTGDACSSYGNRNFFRYYSLWFGRPNGGATPAPTPTTTPAPTPSATPTPAPSAPPTSPPAPSGVFTSAVVHPDQDGTGDGVGDLLVVRQGKAVVVDVTTATKGPRLSLNTLGTVGQGWSSTRTVNPGDWDGDGTADLMLIRGDGTLWLYRGSGNGWQAPRQVGQGWGPYEVANGGYDLTGDGRPDLLVKDPRSGALFIYPSGLGGTFSACLQVGQGWAGMRLLTVVPIHDGRAPAVAAVEASSGRLRLYPMDGRGQFVGRSDLGWGWDSMRSLTGIPDADGDRRGDLLALTSSGGVRLYPASAGGFSTGPDLGVLSAMRSVLSVGVRAPGTVLGVDSAGLLVRHTVTARSDPPRTLDTGISVGSRDRMLLVGDWDGDSFPDIMRVGGDGYLDLFRGQGNGRWLTVPRRVGQGWGIFSQVLPVSNWNGSGRPGLLGWNASSGEVRLYGANGSGGFTDGFAVVGRNVTGVDLLADAGDWASTGGPQLLARRTSDGALLLLRSNPAGLLAQQASVVGVGWRGVQSFTGVADVNGDRRDDLIAVLADGSLRLYPGAGSGKFAEPASLGTF